MAAPKPIYGGVAGVNEVRFFHIFVSMRQGWNRVLAPALAEPASAKRAAKLCARAQNFFLDFAK